MAKETENGTLITLDFSGTEKKFTNTDELHKFMQSQQDAWAWLEKVALQDGNLDRVWDIFKEYFMQGDEFIEHYEMNGEVRKLQIGMINGLRKQTEIAVRRGFILAETPIACFVLYLKDNKSPQVAGYALASLNGIEIEANNPAAHEGVFLAMKYLQRYSSDSVREQQKKLDERNKLLIRETTALQKQSALLIKKTEEQVTMQASHFEEQVSEQAKNFEKQTAEKAIDFEIIVDDAKKKLADFEAFFNEMSALRSPAEYWDEKSINHRKTMHFMAFTTVAIAVLAGGVFVTVALNIPSLPEITVPDVKVDVESQRFYLDLLSDQGTHHILTKISVLLSISTIGVWLARLSAKIFISNMHLKMDAEERATMFQAYIALLLQDRGLNDVSRQLIIQTLFRPSTKGFIKDEGPTSVPETLAKSASQQLKK